MAMIPVTNHGSNFQQQGQLDWVALSKTTVQISLGAMARLARAGVESFTINVGIAICRSFAIQSAGQELVNSSISKLKSFGGYGNLMWFGFGMKSIPEEMAQTEEGLALCALCASLSITYDNVYVARVLRELCIVSKAPKELTPSLWQWRCLVDIVAGVFLNSDFALVVNTFQQIIRPSCSSTRSGTRYPPGPVIELAKAIVVVGQVSKGRLFNATFTGGIHCAWLAAFAERVLSLKVEISNTNECIYRSSNNAGTVQVFFIIHHLGVEPSSWSLMITSKSYKLTSGRDILAYGQVSSNLDMNCLIMRSTWSNILHDTFSGDFEKLSNLPGNPLGVYLTCLSEPKQRIEYLDHMRRKGTNLLDSPFPNQLWHEENSTGRRFLEYARKRLPELGKILQSCHKYTREKPLYHGTRAYGQIRGKCECTKHRNFQSPRNEIYPQDTSDICLCTLADVIVVFLWINIVSSVDEAVLPSTSGLGNLYTWHNGITRWEQYSDPPTLGKYRAGLFDIFPWNHYPVLGPALIYEVFTGSSTKKLSVNGYPNSDSTLAKAGSGLCVYRRFLEDPSLSPLAQFQFRVATGYISYEGSHYVDVTDSSLDREKDDFGEHRLWKHINVFPIIEEVNEFKRLAFSYRVSEGFFTTSMSLSFEDIQFSIGNLLGLQTIHDHPHSCSPQRHLILGSTTLLVPFSDERLQLTFKTEKASTIQNRLSQSGSYPNLWMAALWDISHTMGLIPQRVPNVNSQIFCGYPLPLILLLLKADKRSDLIPLAACIHCNIHNIFHVKRFRTPWSSESNIFWSEITGILQFILPDGDTLELSWQAKLVKASNLRIPSPNLTLLEN